MSPRRIGAAALLVVGTLLWTAAIFGLWAQRQALDTDNWVATRSRLLQDDEIRTALGTALVDRLYDASAVQQRLEDTLPPRLDRLAAPAAAGLREVVLRNAPRVLGTPAALEAWQASNRAAHGALVALVEGRIAPGGEVTLDVSALLRQVADRTGLPAGVADRVPPRVAEIQIIQSDQIEAAQEAVALFHDLLWVLAGLAVAAFAGAIALATDRRRTVVSVGVCLVVAAIAVAALRRVAGQAVVGALAEAPNAQGAADDAWRIATSLLAEAAQGSLLLGLMVATAAWLAGPGRVATTLRRVSAPELREHPGVARAGLAVALLLLVWWGPVPWTGRAVPVALLTVAVYAWLEWLRRRTAGEFGDVAPGELGRALGRAVRIGRPRADDTAHDP